MLQRYFVKDDKSLKAGKMKESGSPKHDSVMYLGMS